MPCPSVVCRHAGYARLGRSQRRALVRAFQDHSSKRSKPTQGKKSTPTTKPTNKQLKDKRLGLAERMQQYSSDIPASQQYAPPTEQAVARRAVATAVQSLEKAQAANLLKLTKEAAANLTASGALHHGLSSTDKSNLLMSAVEELRRRAQLKYAEKMENML